MVDPLVAEVAALDPTFAEPVASSIPSVDVAGRRPSRSRFRDNIIWGYCQAHLFYLAYCASYLL